MNHVSPLHGGPKARDGDWLQMASGRRWWPLDPRPADAHWRDIAESLAKLARFAGHTQAAPYSVAQHCCHVANLMPPEWRLYGLLHDAHEAVTGDPLAPLMRSMPPAVRGWWDQVAETNASAIHRAAGLPMPMGSAAAAIDRADRVALATERRDLLAPCEAPWVQELPPPDTTMLRPEPWHQAADRWLAALRSLLPADAPVLV